MHQNKATGSADEKQGLERGKKRGNTTGAPSPPRGRKGDIKPPSSLRRREESWVPAARAGGTVRARPPHCTGRVSTFRKRGLEPGQREPHGERPPSSRGLPTPSPQVAPRRQVRRPSEQAGEAHGGGGRVVEEEKKEQAPHGRGQGSDKVWGGGWGEKKGGSTGSTSSSSSSSRGRGFAPSVRSLAHSHARQLCPPTFPASGDAQGDQPLGEGGLGTVSARP